MLTEPEDGSPRTLPAEVRNAQNQRPIAQLDFDRRAALDQAGRSRCPVLPDHGAYRNAIGVAAMFRIDRKVDAEIGADRLGLRYVAPDEIRRRHRFAANEEIKPDVRAEAKSEDGENREEERSQAAAIHRLSGRSAAF